MVDDNSPDGTGAIVDRLAEHFPVRCLHRPGKMGLSSGVIDGWHFARADSAALGAMDADFSHDPDIIPQMVAALESGGVRPRDRQPLRAGRRDRELAQAADHHLARRGCAGPAAHPGQRHHQRVLLGEAVGARRASTSIRSVLRSVWK